MDKFVMRLCWPDFLVMTFPAFIHKAHEIVKARHDVECGGSAESTDFGIRHIALDIRADSSTAFDEIRQELEATFGPADVVIATPQAVAAVRAQWEKPRGVRDPWWKQALRRIV